ncbi:MAG: hypothetical protein E7641_01760 [Ruminococcaceae bacterium]|nr:hypothetical protein [Oscillospiraceae bacterium]
MKKLIPAISLLAVAAVLMVASTYAWFSMSSQVNASGMQVQATVDSNLLISEKTESNTTNSGAAVDAETGKLSDGNTSSDVNMDGSSKLRPTSSLNGSKWFSATAASLSDYAAKYGTYAQIEEEELDNYRLKTEFYIQRYNPESTLESGSGNLVIDSITVSNKDTLGKSFRVMLVCGSNVVICGPTDANEPTNKAVSSISSGIATSTKPNYATVDSVSANGVATISANNLLVSDVVDNEVYTVQVYIYFDGEDAACKTDNVPASLADYGVTLSFSIAE